MDGLLADLGVSSMQFEDAARGFSFQAEGPLDMRMDPQAELTADQVVNQFDERELADLIYEFGEERRSRRIARAIVRARPITTTAELARVVAAAARPMKFQRIHPATLTFQALRIYVNRELDDLKALTQDAPQVLARAGRLVIISFHSLEDRIVKDAMRDGARQGLYELLTRKPVVADERKKRSIREAEAPSCGRQRDYKRQVFRAQTVESVRKPVDVQRKGASGCCPGPRVTRHGSSAGAAEGGGHVHGNHN